MSDTSQQASVRMERLATLPVFFKLDGKRAVMVGGDSAAAWKVELLAAAGAEVDVYAAEPCDDLILIAAAPPAGAVKIVRRSWREEDLAGASIAVGALDDEAEAASFRHAARLHGVPVNVIDKPSFCDFQFGTIVARSPLVIGISTDGGAPVFGQALRTRMEALLPQGFRAWAQAAKDWRQSVQSRSLDFRRRRRFWEAFTDLALQAGDRSPSAEDEAACMAASADNAETLEGNITLVGCGPGSADDLTFQAARVLQSADLIIYDEDVSKTLVGLSRREAIKRSRSDLGEPATAAMAIACSARGQQVAWLGTGNPHSCLRWVARAGTLDQFGARLQRVAGISSCPHCVEMCDGIVSSAPTPRGADAARG